MPQLAPMPWITTLTLLFLFLSILFSSLWSHRPPQFSLPLSPSSSATTSHTWPWAN